MLTILLTIIIVGLINWYSHHGMAVVGDNTLRLRGLEMAPDTTKVHKTITVMPCCAGKSNSTFCYVQTTLQSFSNRENHNRKLE